MTFGPLLRSDPRTMASVEELQIQLTATQQRVILAESHASELAEELQKLRGETDVQLQKLRAETDTAFKQMNIRSDEAMRLAGVYVKHEDVSLVDMKTMQPYTFAGKAAESYRCWAKKVKAFCNARKDGFRQALESVERETEPVDYATINSMNWAPATQANTRLFDFLITIVADDALIIVENHPGQGFEAWRALSKRYDPAGEQFMFDRMTSLLARERCRDIGELPGAIEKWTRDLGMYEKKTGKTLEKEWRVPIIFQMVPAKHYSEVKARWQLSTEKDITKFSQELVTWANELRLDQPRSSRGQAPMDIDAIVKGALSKDDYTQEQWSEWETYIAECAIDRVGKGKGKGDARRGGGKGGKGKGGKGKCNWCYEEGHHKKDCKKFDEWKKEKDAERKRKGLPPFKPRPRGPAASLDADNQPDGDAHKDDDHDYLGMLADDLEFDCDALDLPEHAGEAVESREPCVSLLTSLPAKLQHEIQGDWEFENDLDVQAERYWRQEVAIRNPTPTKVHNKFMELGINMIDGDDVNTEGEMSLYAGQRGTVEGVSTPEARCRRMAVTPTSTSSQESLAEKMARERRELLEKLARESRTPKSSSTTSPSTSPKSSSTTSPSTSPKSSKSQEKKKKRKGKKGIEEVVKKVNYSEESESENHDEQDGRSVMSASIETQTDVHLLSTARSVTWIPVTDELYPVHEAEVHEAEEHEAEDAPEDEDIELPKDEKACNDVNAVDSVEISDQAPEHEQDKILASEIEKQEDKIIKTKDKASEGSEPMIVFVIFVLVRLVCLALVVLVAAMMLAPGKEASLNPVSPEGGSGVGSRKPLGRTQARLKKGITVDSGAHHNVMPKRLVRKDRIRESEGSRRGMHYVAANKGKIPNEGETDFKFQTPEGDQENWTFQIAEVNKALGAVSDRVDHDYRVVFDRDSRTGKDASYMLDKKNKKAKRMTRTGNVWVMDAVVDLKDIDEGFLRQG